MITKSHFILSIPDLATADLSSVSGGQGATVNMPLSGAAAPVTNWAMRGTAIGTNIGTNIETQVINQFGPGVRMPGESMTSFRLRNPGFRPNVPRPIRPGR